MSKKPSFRGPLDRQPRMTASLQYLLNTLMVGASEKGSSSTTENPKAFC